jgi:hypothetical protein
MMGPPTLTIGQVAHRAGVGVETVRFYEREGLLAPSNLHGTGHGMGQVAFGPSCAG